MSKRFRQMWASRDDWGPWLVAMLLAAAFVVGCVALGVSIQFAAGQLFGISFAAVIVPRLQERWKRQPRLTLTCDVVSPDDLEQPWPVDIERVIRNEVRSALAANAAYRAARSSRNDFLGVTVGARSRFQQQFEPNLNAFEEELREWLDRYTKLTSHRARRADIDMKISNAAGACVADAVRLTLTLPAQLLPWDPEDDRAIGPPPEPPHPVTPFRDHLDYSKLAARSVADLARITVQAKQPSTSPAWSEGRMTIELGTVHPHETVPIAASVSLRATQPGTHTLTWQLHTKSARAPTTGTIEVTVPSPDPARRPIGRLAGIIDYPDIDIVDGEGNVQHARRTEPLPDKPAASRDGTSPIEQMRAQVSLMSWRGLGLDPDENEPDPPGEQQADD